MIAGGESALAGALFVAGTFIRRESRAEVWEFRVRTLSGVAPALVGRIEIEAPVISSRLERAAADVCAPLGWSLVTRISRPGQGLYIAHIEEADASGTTDAPVG